MPSLGNAQENYEKVARRALIWIQENQDQFALTSKDEAKLLPFLKPISELAIAAEVIHDAPSVDQTFRRFSEETIRYCWNQLEKGDVLTGLFAKRPDCIALADVYPIFYKKGLRSEKFEDELRWISELRGVVALELAPWRKVEIDRALLELGIKPIWNMEKEYRATWLAHLPEPWTLGYDSAYSVTHTVFYMTRFGAEPEGMPHHHTEYLKEWVPLWAHYYDRTRNLDLYGEMLMVLRSLHLSDNEEWSSALLNAQTPEGFVPGPFRVSATIDADATDPVRKNFLDHYHTTLVAMMASGMALRFGC